MLLHFRSGSFEIEKINVDITKENEYSEMNKMLIYKIIELEQLLKEEKYINNLIIYPPIDDYRKELISVILSDSHQSIHYSMICKKSDNFKKLENELYKAYPEIKTTEFIFKVNGNIIDKNKTLDENKIKDHDNIIFTPIEI